MGLSCVNAKVWWTYPSGIRIERFTHQTFPCHRIHSLDPPIPSNLRACQTWCPHLNRSTHLMIPLVHSRLISLIYIYIIKLYWCCSAGPLFCLFVVVVVVVGCCVGACFFFGCCVLFWFLLVLRWMKSILGLRLSIWSAQVHLGINPAGAGGYDVSKHPHTG